MILSSYILSSSHVCGGVRWFLDGMSIGLQIRCTMGTWLSFRVKRRSFFQRQWRVLLMLIRSIQKSHLHLPKLIALSWHFETGWGDMATANPSGLAWAANNLRHQQFYQNVRCEKLIVTDPLVFSFSFSFFLRSENNKIDMFLKVHEIVSKHTHTNTYMHCPLNLTNKKNILTCQHVLQDTLMLFLIC